METIIFPKDEFPPIIISMYDKDPFGEEFIGSCMLDFQKGLIENWISLQENEIPLPKWHELEYGKFIIFSKEIKND